MSKINISLASEVIGRIGGFEVRNTMLMAWLTMIVLFVLCFLLSRTKFRMIPGRFQMLIEIAISGLYDLFASVVGDERLSRKFFPLVTTMFIFILMGNWLGILPGVGSVTIQAMHNGQLETVPLFRSMNADVNMTLSIAIISMLAVQFYGIWELGIVSYASKFIVPPWKNPLGTFLGLLEVVSELARLVSFTFRLFGNIFAGEVLLIVISYLVPYIAPVPFLGMEVFVGLIQAFVFALLTTVFLKIAVTEHEKHEGDHVPPPPALPAA
jgi:F-type H+-transporting ATPase subunit a